MDVLKFFTVRLCPWDMHLTGRRRRRTFKEHFTRSSQDLVFILTLLESPYHIFAVVITLFYGYT